jgi:hypothetical protein
MTFLRLTWIFLFLQLHSIVKAQTTAQTEWTKEIKQEWVDKFIPVYVEIGLDESTARVLLNCAFDKLALKYTYAQFFGQAGDEYNKMKVEINTCADEIDRKNSQAKSNSPQPTQQTNWTRETKQEWIVAFTKLLTEQAGFSEAISQYVSNCAVEKIAARMSYTQFTSLGSSGIYDEAIKTSQVCVQEMFSGDGSQGTSGSSNYQSSQSTNNSNTCYKCNGSGKCNTCNTPQRKVHFRACEAPTIREEFRPGYAQCKDCSGYGVMRTNIGCGCPSGSGWCAEGDCYIKACEDGWVECPDCKYYKPGLCDHCNGTGKKQ